MNLLKDSIQSITLEKALTRAVQYLEEYDENYKLLINERNEIMDQNHEMLNYLEYEKPMQLSEDEHRALIHYLELERQIEDMKRYAIYLCGHLDCTSYLRTLNDLNTVREEIES